MLELFCSSLIFASCYAAVALATWNWHGFNIL